MSRPADQAQSSSWNGSASPTRRQAPLAQQAGGQIMEQSEGQSRAGIGRRWQRGLAVELLVGIVLSIVLALVVALAGGVLTAAPEAPVRTIIVPDLQEETEDLDPRDPLIRCETFETHTRCIREAS